MIKRENVIMISGAGRNVGKTLLSEHIIRNNPDVVAFKISPHFHSLTNKQEVLFQQEGIIITRETDSQSTKDTARMIRAGAKEVFYIQAKDDQLLVLLEWMDSQINNDVPVLMETRGMGKVMEPGLALFIENGILGKECHWVFSHHLLSANKVINETQSIEIIWNKQQWNIK
ncbi:hypothetical protein EMN47_17325 [Prolixibacteraceae bacterium JC049]|nr:hypothetical protein [Prolixibacteraceae bacterium JC049]